MSRADAGEKFFETYNCAQAVLAAHAEKIQHEVDMTLAAAAGFGGGMGRLQETCGAVTGAIMALGLSSDFKEGDGRDKINEVYANVRSFVEEFKREKGTVKCRDLLGCDLLTEEGHKYYTEHKLRENCKGYIRLSCDLLDKYLTK